MLRIFLDEHGSGSNDLFVKIDGRPTHVWVVDTSWLSFFFAADDNDKPLNDEELIVEKKAAVSSLIQLWQKMLLSDQTICYLPYYFHDQGGAAFKTIKRKKLHQVIPVWTPDLTETATQSYFFQKQQMISWHHQTNPELKWELAPTSILTGLNWSLAQVEQPVIPLRYK